MSRSLRIEFPRAIYHVMARGVGRMEVFVDDVDRRAFLSLVGVQVESGALVVHAFCLMPNHVHKLCETPFGGLSRCMHDILRAYAQAYNKRHGRVGHLFQGRYRALIVQDGDYLVACSRYIHLNPDGAPSTRPMERYPWSSYQNYAGGPSVVDWVATSKVLSYFKDRDEYLGYLQAGRRTEIADPFKQAFAGVIWGDEEFVREMRALVVKTQAPDLEIPARRLIERFGTKPDIDTVRRLTGEVFGGMREAGRTRVLAYALWRFTWLRGVEIAEALARTPGAVSQSVRHIEDKITRDPAMRAGFEQIERELRRLAAESCSAGPNCPHPDDWYRRQGQEARRLRRRLLRPGS